MRSKIFYIILTLFLISCSTTNSDSYSNIIGGTVKNVNGGSVQNAQVGVIYRFIDNEVDYSISNYPNPFHKTTTISYEIESNRKYTLKAQNLDSSNEVVLIDEEKEAGIYSTSWNPSDDGLEKGFYKLTDNLENEAIIFYAPVIPVNNGNETINIAGQTIGDFITTTDSNGNFEFNKNEIISSEKAFILTNEIGTEQAIKTLKKEVYIVAYTKDENYDIELINYEEQNSSIELSI